MGSSWGDTSMLHGDIAMPSKTWNFSKRKNAKKVVKKGNIKQSDSWRAFWDAKPAVRSNNQADQEILSYSAPVPISILIQSKSRSANSNTRMKERTIHCINSQLRKEVPCHKVTKSDAVNILKEMIAAKKKSGFHPV